MKTSKVRSKSVTSGVKHRELLAKISVAQKQAESARKTAKAAKVDYKRVRKAHRLAKQTAKEARKEFKALKKLLAEAHAAATRRKRATSVKPVRVRKPAQAASSAAPVALPAAASVPEPVVATATPGESPVVSPDSPAPAV